MHVSKDGNDSTGTGTILRPYLTITHALTQVNGDRNTIVIHPGGYTENPTITSLATQLITYDATGASTLVYGTVTIANTTGRIAGLKMTNLAITGNAQAYINSSTVDEQFTKSSSGYVEVDDCELQTTGNVLISGSGIITIIGNKINNLVVNNAGASVLVKGANDCVMPQVIAGSLNIVDSTIRASSNTANAVTASVGTVVTLMNNQIVTPASDTVARVSIAGYHSIISVVYDKANSTLSNSLNSVVYFQTANVDSLVSSGNVTGGNISTTGNVTAAYFIGNGSLLTGISATANTGNVSFNDVTVQGVTSYGGLNISASPEDTANLKYLRVRSGDADSHIHFDSGNNSQYDIIFGDDSKYLMVSNTGNVVVGTNGYTWTFGNTGTTQFPGSKILAPVSESITMQSDQYSQLMWENANLTVAPNMAINSNFYVAQNNATLDIVYRDGSSNQQQKSWLWNADGTLTFPDATVQATAWTGIPGPYADDEAAALAGVALGSPYYKTGTGGQVFVRLTSPT
jgi:hypothetical protein